MACKSNRLNIEVRADVIRPRSPESDAIYLINLIELHPGLWPLQVG
jgi:hypothetical protein